MKGLELLKRSLLKQTPTSNEQDTVTNLCFIMESVGGYEQLMNLPLSAIEPILKFMKFKNEQQAKKFGLAKKN